MPKMHAVCFLITSRKIQTVGKKAFELESKFLYEPDREPHTGVWIIYTKVFFSNVKGNSNKETYAFGWNKTIYPTPKIFDMNLPYDQECNHRKRKFGEDDY